MRFRVLGPLEAVDETGRARSLGPPRHRALLAALLVHAGTVLTVDRLTDLMWDGDPPPTARTMVHGAVAALRGSLGLRGSDRATALLTRDGGYVLHCPAGQLDVTVFEQLLASGRRHRPAAPERAAGAFADALRLWRGPALAGMDNGFARRAADRWEELHLECAEERIEAELVLGHHREVVTEAEALVVEYPFRERLRALLALSLYRSGRQADALATLRAARRTFAEELGLRPGADLQRLERAVLEQSPRLDLPRVAPPAPPVGRALPAPISAFVGRVRERADVSAMVAAHRLVTLTGPGGSGKTRLAHEVAGELRERGSSEVWWTDLAPLTVPELVGEAVAEALGVRTGHGQRPVDAIGTALLGRPVLFLIDNCEHLAGECAVFVGRLLAAAPDLRLLVTGREALNIAGEQVYPVRPLPTAAAGDDWQRIAACDAVRLFSDRVSARRPGFAVTQGNAGLVLEICRRLDGLPLALELAAARAASLSLPDLAERLDGRFRLLDSAVRTGDARHRSLTAALTWSHDLLGAAERRLFARISVFPAPFTLAAAEDVASGPDLDRADIGRLLAGLVNSSTVQPADGTDGRARYRLLETTRQYARERLPEHETDAGRRRHALHYAGLAEATAPHLLGPGSSPRLELLHAEHDHIRVALEWAFAPGGDPLLGARLVGNVWHAWDLRGMRGEGVHWVHAGLRAVGPETVQERLGLLSAGALFHLGRAEFADATRLAGEQLVLARAAGARQWEGDALRLSATAAWVRGEFDRAAHLYEDAVAVSLVAGDLWRASLAESLLARLHRDREEPDAARAVVERALRHAGRVGEGLARGLAVDVLASLELRWGDPAAARRLADEALGHYRAVGYVEGEVSGLQLGGRIAMVSGEYESAREAFEHSLRWCRRIGLRGGIPSALEGLAGVAAALGDDERALVLLGAAAALREEIGAPLAGAAGRDHQQDLDRLVVRSGAAAADRALRRGGSLGLDALVDASRSLADG